MKQINDSKIYLYASIVTLSLSLIMAIIFSYSAFYVEPEIRGLLAVKEGVDINENIKKAYIKLKSPHIFALYEYFDRQARPVRSIMQAYDRRIADNEEFSENDILYLEILLGRRMQGSKLTRNTMVFFFAISLFGLLFYLYEKKQIKTTGKQ